MTLALGHTDPLAISVEDPNLERTERPLDGSRLTIFEAINGGKHIPETSTALALLNEKGIVNSECWRICLIGEKKL